ncbi:hypothetical protein PR048_030960 [Dryococelus australis]|uniref:Uncharacterized protein n=1 Tax=Dryococelus australis TaxID=614101 RepID=A0ABQ9GE57_9NEOP|nr:hypothetical protein PR048_030960 [Dryococelus australis]
MGFVPDDAASQRVFSGISHFPRPYDLALLHFHLISPSSALKTSSAKFWTLLGVYEHINPLQLIVDNRQHEAQESGTIPIHKDSGIEPSSPWWETSRLTAHAPRPSMVSDEYRRIAVPYSQTDLGLTRLSGTRNEIAREAGNDWRRGES